MPTVPYDAPVFTTIRTFSITRAAGTKAEFNNAVTDGDILFVGDVSSGASVTVQDEGSNITTALATLNFVGAGVTVTGGTTATVTIPSSSYVHPNHSGDAASVADGAITLATVNGNVGSFGLAGSVAQFTVNAKGLITAAANLAISIASAAISDSTAAGRAFLTAATAAAQTALLDVFTSGAKGLVPASGGGTTNFLRADGTFAAPAGGSGNAVAASLAFGASFTDKAQTVVTGQAWVAAGSKIVADVLTPSGTDPDEMYLLDLRPVISSLVAGVGFTVTLYSEAHARGTYTVNCIGV